MTNLSAFRPRLDLLVARGQVSDPVPECDLIAKAVVNGRHSGFYMTRDGQFLPDQSGQSELNLDSLLGLIGTDTDSMTFTCSPWGSGERMGIDRDGDGTLDGDEL